MKAPGVPRFRPVLLEVADAVVVYVLRRAQGACQRGEIGRGVRATRQVGAENRRLLVAVEDLERLGVDEQDVLEPQPVHERAQRGLHWASAAP